MHRYLSVLSVSFVSSVSSIAQEYWGISIAGRLGPRVSPLLPGSAPRPRVSYEECPGDRHAGIPRGVSMDSTSLTAMTAFNARDTSDASDTAINAPACTLHPAKLSAVWGKFEN